MHVRILFTDPAYNRKGCKGEKAVQEMVFRDGDGGVLKNHTFLIENINYQ
jgi:hypothetical protein